MVTLNTEVKIDALYDIVDSSRNVLSRMQANRELLQSLEEQRVRLKEQLTEKLEETDTLSRAAYLLSTVSDKNTQRILDRIVGVINGALGLLFTGDTRVVSIEKTMYRETYPHYNLTLTVGNGVRRVFKCSGSGLAQIVSFIFTLALIDAQNARRVFVMDEVLSGLHPDAKGVIKALLEAQSRTFQFVVVEYGLDVGKQYIVNKTGVTADVREYRPGTYYSDVAQGVLKYVGGLLTFADTEE